MPPSLRDLASAYLELGCPQCPVGAGSCQSNLGVSVDDYGPTSCFRYDLLRLSDGEFLQGKASEGVSYRGVALILYPSGGL